MWTAKYQRSTLDTPFEVMSSLAVVPRPNDLKDRKAAYGSCTDPECYLLVAITSLDSKDRGNDTATNKNTNRGKPIAGGFLHTATGKIQAQVYRVRCWWSRKFLGHTLKSDKEGKQCYEFRHFNKSKACTRI